MDNKIYEKIFECIECLKRYGYEVYKCGDSKINKWIAFRQEGMSMVLHGKVIGDCGTYYVVRCKNGGKRFAGLKDVIGFYDSKAECYSVKD